MFEKLIEELKKIKCKWEGMGCGECPLCFKTENGNRCVSGLCKYAADAIEYLDAWIPVENRLPEKQETVLCAVYGSDILRLEEGETYEDMLKRIWSEPGYVTICFLDDDGNWCDGYFGGPQIITPKYWRPFPKAPKNPYAEVLEKTGDEQEFWNAVYGVEK